VIIPAYNEGPLLASAIESALRQTYGNLEVIVVNDGSPDAITRQTAECFGERIVYIERENGGVAAARNTGISAARGDLIALLDQDDVWLPHKLATQVAALRAHPHVALAHSSYYLIDADGERIGLQKLPQREWKPLPELLVDVPIASCTTLFPRGLLDEVGLFDPELAGSDDWDLWLRMAARGYSFYCVGEPLAEYRVHNANTSRDIDLMVRAGLRVLDKFYAMPNLPVEALRYRHRAYFGRHAWAAAVYYGADRFEEAREHLRLAAQCDPQGVATGRFLQSMIHAGAERPTYHTAQGAVGFVRETLRGQPLATSARRKLRAYAHLTLAFHSGASIRRQLGHVVSALLTYPGLVANRSLWASVKRKAIEVIRQPMRKHNMRGGAKPQQATGRFSLIVKPERRGWSPWAEQQAEFKYGGTLQLATLTPNDSHGRMIEMIPPGARVLETGCANGRFSRVLVEHGCQVVGVEIDPEAAAQASEACEQVIVGNLEDPHIQEQIPGQFDVVLFGDVLEHLARPWDVLRAVRSRLGPGGCIVTSIPNVAHWDVRMDLLRGNFNYQYEGVLDSTHLRFFTRRTAWEMIEQAGYRIVADSRVTRLPAMIYSIRLVRRFAPIMLLPLLERLAPNLFTLQFVLKAVPRD
jgi:glycosyltransferase involved in cell wall biosynthesis/2-polyprenyl-3-methyl-5-hydroxy-6-metoxy-1,4-benzoquinol methylase